MNKKTLNVNHRKMAIAIAMLMAMAMAFDKEFSPPQSTKVLCHQRSEFKSVSIELFCDTIKEHISTNLKKQYDSHQLLLIIIILLQKLFNSIVIFIFRSYFELLYKNTWDRKLILILNDTSKLAKLFALAETIAQVI